MITRRTGLVAGAALAARPGSNFYLRIEQEIDGQITGGYTVVITVA